ncbi:insulinase family protein [Thomasclavelia cocleata]|uniref:Predicted Zn-dependent peptidase n=1 Tax=Thomasclavelia cocleata TaxID=69824 RepID=A0A1I0B9D1_9FIRM|nr:pitrilysin family protein [Thomasclavelia cocleata]MCR1959973.1 insulinase family protein [Thomasclavelia cocleata]NDO41684.1 insulinase family protein [Thomasclavelia cocleata]PJN79723.1 insulinase family protein [Thomasclavelia cocleata]SET03395.1 Predicted Zn-dependent peptidase [Thomasclavelia cocleata]
MEKLYFKTLKETLYHETMDNGLEVFLLPKPDFEKTYGLFTTKFGAIDTTFVPINQDEMIKVEDGIAHFLEHKMFDMNGSDASDEFAKLGASTNAFTSSSRTAYLFSTTTNEYPCIELLLDFVQKLEITPDSVEKEKGIIGQEIKMYDDDPDWRVYFGSIQNLYCNHPVAVDIAGTVETVNNTTKEMLELCYNTFYHPSNMMLFVVGNIEADKAISVIKENQAKKDFEAAKEIVCQKNIEPCNIKTKEEILTMDVEMNKIIVSIKINEILNDPKQKIRRELAINLLFDLLFSKSAKLYNEWLNKGIINDSFSANFTQERDYAFIQIGCDCDDYQILKDHLFNLIENFKDIEISKDDFERIKKKNIGLFINLFNGPESIANLFSRYYFEGTNALNLVDEIAKITLDDIYEMFKYFDLEYTSTCIVKKK